MSMIAKDRDLAAAQHLVSHLCHELVSPIGAVNNGVELLTEQEDGAIDPEITDLIAESGRSAAARLRFYRYAYGAAGRAHEFRMRDARAAAADLFALDPRVDLDWPTPIEGPEPEAGGAQIALNLTLLAAGFLPRGGMVSVRTEVEAEQVRVRVAAKGEGAAARAPEHVLQVLEGDGVVDHRSAHAYYCKRLAVAMNIPLALSVGSAEVAIEVCLRAALDDLA